MKKSALTTSMLLFVYVIISPKMTYSEQTDATEIVILSYHITLKPNFHENSVNAVVDASCENHSDIDRQDIDFDLCTTSGISEIVVKDLVVTLADDDASTPLTVNKVRVSGTTYRPYRVSLPKSIESNETISLRFYYQLAGQSNRNCLPIWYANEPELYLITDFGWLPTVFALPKVAQFNNILKPSWTLNLEYPSVYTAVADGRLVDRHEDGDQRIETWESIVGGLPILFIADYFVTSAQYGEYTIEAYTAHDATLQGNVEAISADLSKVLQIYTRLFSNVGSNTYRLVSTYVNGGGHAGFMTQGISSGYIRNMDIKTVTHEAAHTWWSRGITSYGEGSKFLREAFAQFFSAWALKDIKGEDYFNGMLRDFKSRVFTHPSPLDGYPLIFQEGDDPSGITGANYFKGPLVLNALRIEIGDDDFFQAIRSFAENYFGQNVTMQDMIESFNELAGEDLTTLFHNLCWSTDYPQYTVTSYEMGQEGENYFCRVWIENQGSYGLQCPIALITEESIWTEIFSVEGYKEQDFTFVTDAPVTEIIIDPEETYYQYYSMQWIETDIPLWSLY